MAELFDDISRIAGSKISRREAARLIARALVGGAAISLWPRSTQAFAQQATCNSQFTAGATAQYPLQDCNAYKDTASATPAKTTACASASDTARNSAATKCPAACPSIQQESWTCPQSVICADLNTIEVRGSGQYKCVCKTIVCGGHCCSSGQICCGGTTCCAPSACTNGRCFTPSLIRP